jgi:hypothetical protein
MYKCETISRYILNEVETCHHLISIRTLSSIIIQFTCNAVNTHLNHRRIFLFSTPCGVGSLLCMRNINCKPHWLAICTILITEDDHNHIFFLTIATQLFFFITYNKMKKYISHCRNSSNKWWHASTSFKTYLEILSYLYITFTIFYYNTISINFFWYHLVSVVCYP